MTGCTDPAAYEAWYGTARGRWIAARELVLMLRLAGLRPGERLLDAGCGTGHFSRAFAASGLEVTGLDPDARALAYARRLGGHVRYVVGDMRAPPFAPGRFDHVAAVTSLCFVERPAEALAALWPLARRTLVLGLLHRRSLLYLRKRGRGGYAGARWDTRAEALAWLRTLRPAPARVRWGTAVLLPGGGPLAHLAERLLGGLLPWGGFLAVAAYRPDPERTPKA